jgi:hypothetical protein
MKRGLCLPLLLLAASAFPESVDENRNVIRKAAELLVKDDENWAKLLFVRRREVKELDSAGKLKSKNSVTVRREPYEDLVVSRVIARNDLPLTAAEHKKQDETIKSGVDSLRQRIAKEGPQKPETQRRKSGDAEIIQQFPEALDYKLIGSENKFGHQTNVYEFSPRAGYSAPNLKYRMFEKVRGKCWVDKATNQLVLVEAEVYDHVTVGFGVVGRIGKGTQFRLQRNEALPGMWVVESQTMKFDARLMLVKNLRQEVDVRYSEFRLRPETKQTARR